MKHSVWNKKWCHLDEWKAWTKPNIQACCLHSHFWKRFRIILRLVSRLSFRYKKTSCHLKCLDKGPKKYFFSTTTADKKIISINTQQRRSSAESSQIHRKLKVNRLSPSRIDFFIQISIHCWCLMAHETLKNIRDDVKKLKVSWNSPFAASENLRKALHDILGSSTSLHHCHWFFSSSCRTHFLLSIASRGGISAHFTSRFGKLFSFINNKQKMILKPDMIWISNKKRQARR